MLKCKRSRRFPRLKKVEMYKSTVKKFLIVNGYSLITCQEFLKEGEKKEYKKR